MALQARLMSQALRKITALCSKSDCIVVFINQLRQKIGVFFGNPEVTTGGNALKFYCSVRLDIRRIGSIKRGDEIIGNRVRIKVIKNKMAPPFGSTEIDVLFNQGISHLGSVVDLAVEEKIIEKSGAWFAYQGEKIGQGRENAKLFLRKNPATLIAIENAIYDKKQLTHLKKELPKNDNNTSSPKVEETEKKIEDTPSNDSSDNVVSTPDLKENKESVQSANNNED